MLPALRGERGGADEPRVEVPSSWDLPARRGFGPRRPCGRCRPLVAVGLRETGYGGGGSGSCE